MRKIVSIILVTGLLFSSVVELLPNGKSLRYIENDAYGYGEILEYDVGYKFITAGTGYFKIMPDPIYRNGRKCYDIRFQVKSHDAIDWLYRVRDQYRTVLDVGGIFPWEFEQTIREGGYSRDSKAHFDQLNNVAKSNDKTFQIPDYVHDVVSAFYYVRTMDIGSMKKDSIFYLKNFLDDTTYNLGVKIKGKQTIEVAAGTFKCVVIEPMIVQGGLFKSDGTVLIWLSDDDRKIPVKVATKIPIGYIEAKLTKFSGLRGQLNAKIN